MNEVFVDTNYLIALTVPGDAWSEQARQARANIPDARLVTTDEVLIEFLAAVSSAGGAVRERAVTFVRRVLTNRNVTVVAQSRSSFLRGLDLYESRSDKSYSLTDCIAMTTMQERGIQDILSADRDFEREGFTALMRDAEDR